MSQQAYVFEAALDDVNAVLREAFGWHGDFPYSFRLDDGREYAAMPGEESDVPLGRLGLEPDRRIEFFVNGPEEWEFALALLEVRAEDDPLPRVIERHNDLQLEAIDALPRAEFVPPDLAAYAYQDSPLPIPHGQVTTQPSLVAQMVAALELAPSDRVLEIGGGFGWQTALLARVADEVWSVERWEDIARTARANLERVGVENATVVVGDGSLGLPEHAPYDAVLVAAAFRQVPGPLADQLAEGGRLVQPIGLGGADEVVLFEQRGGGLERGRLVTGAHFVRLYGEHGFRE